MHNWYQGPLLPGAILVSSYMAKGLLGPHRSQGQGVTTTPPSYVPAGIAGSCPRSQEGTAPAATLVRGVLSLQCGDLWKPIRKGNRAESSFTRSPMVCTAVVPITVLRRDEKSGRLTGNWMTEEGSTGNSSMQYGYMAKDNDGQRDISDPVLCGPCGRWEQPRSRPQ